MRPSVRANGVPPALSGGVPRDATPALADLVAWLGPGDVHVRYPGVWLADRVWATHGHYLDRHLLPEAAYGVARGLLGRLPRDGATPADYEGGPSATRVEAMLTRWLPRPLAELMDELAELLRAATMPGSPRRVLGRHLAPFAQRALGAQMRRASIPALARVVHRLGVDADWVVFGHVHRWNGLSEWWLALFHQKSPAPEQLPQQLAELEAQAAKKKSPPAVEDAVHRPPRA